MIDITVTCSGWGDYGIRICPHSAIMKFSDVQDVPLGNMIRLVDKVRWKFMFDEKGLIRTLCPDCVESEALSKK